VQLLDPSPNIIKGKKMTEVEKVKIFELIKTSKIEQVVKFAKEQEHDLDTVFGLLVTHVHDIILDYKLGLE